MSTADRPKVRGVHRPIGQEKSGYSSDVPVADRYHDEAMTSQVENEDVDELSDDRSTGSGRWAAWAFRVPITLAAVLLFNQSLNAGEFMSGKYEFLEFHMFGATTAWAVVGLAVVGAGWAWFRGGYPLWLVGVTALLFAAIRVQIWAGEQRALSVHVPLGVSIIVVAIGLTVWAWRS